MKNEHFEFDELYRLAEIEVQGEVYSEEEKKELQHLIECEECYERYCAAALSLAALDGINAETLAVMAEKGDFEKADRVGKGGRKKFGIGDFNNVPKGS